MAQLAAGLRRKAWGAFLSGCPTKSGLPQEGLPFFPGSLVTEQLRFGSWVLEPGRKPKASPWPDVHKLDVRLLDSQRDDASRGFLRCFECAERCFLTGLAPRAGFFRTSAIFACLSQAIHLCANSAYGPELVWLPVHGHAPSVFPSRSLEAFWQSGMPPRREPMRFSEPPRGFPDNFLSNDQPTEETHV